MLCLEIQQLIDKPDVMKFYLFDFRKDIDLGIEFSMEFC